MPERPLPERPLPERELRSGERPAPFPAEGRRTREPALEEPRTQEAGQEAGRQTREPGQEEGHRTREAGRGVDHRTQEGDRGAFQEGGQEGVA